MLRRWIAGASPLHVHGNCHNRVAYDRHLPLWSRPINMRQTWPQTKFVRVKTNVAPSHTRFCMGQYLLFVHKPVHLGKSVSAWVVFTLRMCKPIKGMGRKRIIFFGLGAPLTPDSGANNPHTVGTLKSALCNPWTPTCLQPYAQNPNPTPKKGHPRATQMMAVTRLGRHGNRHPCEPGYTHHLSTYTQTAVAATVKLRVIVKMALDTCPTITAVEGWFGQSSF